MPVKKIVIINRHDQASDAQTVLRYFFYLSGSLMQLEKKLNCSDIAPLTEENLYRMANKCKEHNTWQNVVVCQSPFKWLSLVSRQLLHSCWTFRRISVTISSRNVPVLECDISRRCSCILSSMWNIAIQQRMDKSKLDVESSLSSFLSSCVCFFPDPWDVMSLLFLE